MKDNVVITCTLRIRAVILPEAFLALYTRISLLFCPRPSLHYTPESDCYYARGLPCIIHQNQPVIMPEVFLALYNRIIQLLCPRSSLHSAPESACYYARGLPCILHQNQPVIMPEVFLVFHTRNSRFRCVLFNPQLRKNHQTQSFSSFSPTVIHDHHGL